MWSEDFESRNYSAWTSEDYGNDWKDGFCHGNTFSSDHAVSGEYSHRSEITCPSEESHRGYGGVQFEGDSVLPEYTNIGTGTEAPYGVVNTFWSWLSVPYQFGSGKWLSLWTANNDCGWQDRVITLGFENSSNVLTPGHILNSGGSVNFASSPPAFPNQVWVRTTVHINYHTGQMHVWQDGEKVLDATFSREDTDICQWHWGAYASGDNDDIVLYEDDLSIWKLNEPWEDFNDEPYFGVATPVCDG